MENIPVPPTNPEPAGWKPTASTNIAIVAGAAVQIISAICAHFGLVLDATTQGSLTVLVMVASSYIHPDGGRK